jgi:hypothetical protein
VTAQKSHSLTNTTTTLSLSLSFIFQPQILPKIKQPQPPPITTIIPNFVPQQKRTNPPPLPNKPHTSHHQPNSQRLYNHNHISNISNSSVKQNLPKPQRAPKNNHRLHPKAQITLPPKPSTKHIPKPFTKLQKDPSNADLTSNPPSKTPRSTPKSTFLTHQDLNNAINTSKLFPSTVAVKDDIGKSGLMWPRAFALKHNASSLLNRYSTQGCPADCGKPWSRDHIITALTRGPHISAKSEQARECLVQETRDKIKGGFAKVIKWKDIKDDPPINLKISPIAMIPHKSRKFRAILDLSFQMRMKGSKMPSVNSATSIKAPQKSMAELGNVLKRIVHTMATNFNPNAPFVFSKCDIKDGFWRMSVSPEDSWNFCYVMPPAANTKQSIDETEIVIPHSLQMGWCESPPFFCAATETARDIIQDMFHSDLQQLPSHDMEHYLLSKVPDLHKHSDSTTSPTVLFEVFVDDFVGISNCTKPAHLQRLSQALLHGIHCIFPPPSVTQHNGGDPISKKKMEQGDGQWDHTKEILGWIFDGKNYTIELPPGKVQKIQALIKGIAKREKSALKQYQTMAGKLQHLAFGLPAGKGLFSPLYKAMKNDPPEIQITPNLKQALQDWLTIITRVNSRPTSVLELTPGPPAYVGYVDACGFGAGGVWISGTKTIKHTVWRTPFPSDIEARIVSDKNPTGDITNSDLEMAGVLLQWLILEQCAPTALAHTHVGIFCDNTPTVAWTSRLHSSKSKTAGFLLRALAVRQHVNRVSPLTTISIAGENNQMADVASRSFRLPKFTNSTSSFANSFTTQFPLSQPDSWTECPLDARLRSRVISCLRGDQLEMASWLKIPKPGKNIGHTGENTVRLSTKTHTSVTATQPSKSSSSQPSLLGSGLATTAKNVESKFNLSNKRSLPFQRQSSWLGNLPQSTKQRRHTRSQWHGWLKECEGKTPRQSHKLQSQSVSQRKSSTKLKNKSAKKQKPSVT